MCALMDPKLGHPWTAVRDLGSLSKFALNVFKKAIFMTQQSENCSTIGQGQSHGGLPEKVWSQKRQL